jgi:hypothetical protein
MNWKIAGLILIILICTAGCITLFPPTGGTPPAAASISGTVTCESGCGDGPVYVIAIARENAGRYRNIETTTPVYTAPEVAGYANLTGPGPYRITGLKNGNYTVYAWQDKNRNGGIEHLGYAEPTGWYQTADHLRPAAVDATGGAAEINISLIAPLAYQPGERSVKRGNGGGTIKQVRNFSVLHLYGTPEERAYASGYLTAPQVMDFLNYVIIENFAGSTVWYEDEFLPYLRNNFSAYRQYDGDVEEFLAGMRDTGTDMEVRWLNRTITADDIYAINTFYFEEVFRGVAPQGKTDAGPRVSCSSAVAWGNLTKNAELNGSIIHGKNMDGENDLRKVTVNSLLIIALEPAPGSGQKRVVDVDWPGFIGTFNPMNEDGIYLAPHASVTLPDYGATDHIDYPLMFRPIILQASSTDEVLDLWHRTKGTLSAGFVAAISQPVGRRSSYPPSVILECDAYGDRIRLPGAIWPENPEMIFTANNFYAYRGVKEEAVESLKAYHDAVYPDDYRYRAMADQALQYLAERGSIGTPEMIGIMRKASTSKEYQGETEYSFIAYPDMREFALAREDLQNKVLDASFAQYERFAFDEVFARSP